LKSISRFSSNLRFPALKKYKTIVLAPNLSGLACESSRFRAKYHDLNALCEPTFTPREATHKKPAYV